ncbi:MAG: hypothetical protein ACLFO1_10415 [Spirochaetaceae bacterium]
MKRLMLAVVGVGLVIILGGCGGGLFGPSAELAGSWNALRVDGDGHFRDDVTYQYGYSTQIYGADGTITLERFDVEEEGEDEDGDGTTGEGVVKTETLTGTYTYDPDTPQITWNWSTRSYPDGTTESDLNWTETLTTLFTENGTLSAYVQSSSDANSFELTRTFLDQDDAGNDTYYSEQVDSYTIDVTAGAIQNRWTRTEADTREIASEGDLEQDEVDVENVSTYPTGETWKRGSTVTFRGVETSDRYRSRASASDDWSAWSDDGLGFRSMTFIHFGSFITWVPDSAAQSIGTGSALD